MAVSSYEKIVTLMQEQGAVNNSASLQVGIMTSDKTCKIGELELDQDDLLIDERLVNPVLTVLDFNILANGGASHTHDWSDKSTYLKPLKKGDKVAIQRVSDDLYIIVGKLVSL